MSKDYKLYQLIDNLNYFIDYNNIQILSAEDFYNHVNQKYHNWLFTSWSYNATETETNNLNNAKEAFLECFGTWVVEVGDTYLRTLYNLKNDYKLLNTFEKEIIGQIDLEKHKGSKKSTSLNEILKMAKGTKIETSSKSIQTPNYKTKNSNYTNGFDNTTPVLKDYSESEVLEGNVTVENPVADNYTNTTGTDTNTKTASSDDNYVTFSDISETIFDRDVTKYNGYKESGYNENPVNNLKHEIEIRMKNFTGRVIDTFIREYCFYVE